MPDFIFQANVAHYKELLPSETDARKIATLRRLLAEEETKLADFRANNRRSRAAEANNRSSNAAE